MRALLGFRLYFLVLLAVVGFFLPAARASETIYTTVDATDPLEMLGHSARAAAMGSAFTAVSGDTADLFWNPAGLAELFSGQLSLEHQSWVANINQETLTLGLPISPLGSFALSSTYLSYGNVDGYDASGSATGAYQPNRFSATLGWGQKLFPGFSLGFTVTGLRQSIVQYTYQSLFTGLGVLWSPFSDLRVALSADLGSFAPDFSDSGVIRTGLAWTFRGIAHNPTLLTADFSMPFYGDYQIQVGVEQTLSWIFLRAGYQLDLVNNEIQGFQGFSTGLGFRLEDFDLDYAFLPEGDLGASQEVSLTYRFEEAPTSAVSKSPAVVEPAIGFKPSKHSPTEPVEKVELNFDLPDEPPPTPGPVDSQLTQGIQDYVKAVQDDPQNAKKWAKLGALYYHAGQADNAFQCLEQALRLRPDNFLLKRWLEKYDPSKR